MQTAAEWILISTLLCLVTVRFPLIRRAIPGAPAMVRAGLV
jgi:hypothetical protein